VKYLSDYLHILAKKEKNYCAMMIVKIVQMRIFGIHEYELKDGIDPQYFELVLKSALLNPELDIPGLESRHFLKGYKATRKGSYAVLWVFKSQEALEELFGTEDKPKRGPPNFVEFEDIVLNKFLDRPADEIVFTDYWELAGRYSCHK
jgi:hypothetical protein